MRTKQPSRIMPEHKKKQLKLLYYSHTATDLQEITLGWKKILTLVVACMSVLLLLVSFVLGFFNRLSQNWEVMTLARAHQKLSNVISDMHTRIHAIEGIIQHIEKQDSTLNPFVDAPAVPKSAASFSSRLATLGFGDAAAVLVDQKNAEMEKSRIDELQRRLAAAGTQRAQLTEIQLAKLQQLRRTPSVHPLHGGRISEPFGWSMDPTIDQLKYHEGIDFSALQGTPVYATADGVVKELGHHFGRSGEYGRYVLVDHGDGRQTRYAHLKDIKVKPGQKVLRFMVLGVIDEGGPLVGSHLHYEVLDNGRPVDPAAFLLD
ncbi:M23 family metallopeptidase [bacterium]|nr:M23 family metallopeptidase [bacterium]